MISIGDKVRHRRPSEEYCGGTVEYVDAAGQRALVRWPRWPLTPSEELVSNLEEDE